MGWALSTLQQLLSNLSAATWADQAVYPAAVSAWARCGGVGLVGWGESGAAEQSRFRQGMQPPVRSSQPLRLQQAQRLGRCLCRHYQPLHLVPFSRLQVDTSYEEVANELIADIAAEVAAGAPLLASPWIH